MVNISLMVWFDKNWALGNGKKIGVLMFQKVAKTGNIGVKKKKAIDYLLTVLFLYPFFFFFCVQIIGVYLGKCGIVSYGTCVSAQLRHSTGVNFWSQSSSDDYLILYFDTFWVPVSFFIHTRQHANVSIWLANWTMPFAFLMVGFLWSCINFLRYRAASDPNQRHADRTEEIRSLVMTCCKLYLLDIR